MKLLTIIFVAFAVVAVNGQHDPHWLTSRSVMVHLFEWKWADIAKECEEFLAPNGYAGVQVSPATENTVIRPQPNRPWWERYQPVSYKVITRSGSEAAFVDMTRRCNAVGVRIYIDLLLNHMSATTGVGTAGSTANAETRDYPAVPFTAADFHAPCEIDWGNADSIRRCQLVGLPDLDQSREHVRAKLAEYMNHFIDLGVAGFRADAMKHMHPIDLENIFARLKPLNTNFGFASNSKAFIVGEVIDNGGEAISGTEYFPLGTITEFRYSNDLSRTFRGNSALRWLQNFGEGWNFHPSQYSLTFVDNHDNQRGGALSYKDGRLYIMASAFHLAWNYGIPRVMSSFDFTGHDQGPPQDANGNLLSPVINADGISCSDGWICEHRWREISNMVRMKCSKVQVFKF